MLDLPHLILVGWIGVPLQKLRQMWALMLNSPLSMALARRVATTGSPV
jgi:hypothetical protein